MTISHVDRIRKRDHIIAFAKGATVCLCVTFIGTALFLNSPTGRGL